MFQKFQRLRPTRIFSFQYSYVSQKQLNHYEVLGVLKTSSKKDIRLAFLRLSKELHPDIQKGSQTGHKEFVKINQAYSILIKDRTREMYDLSLDQRSAVVHPSYQAPPSAPDFHSNSPYYHYYERNFDREGSHEARKDPYYGVKGIPKVSKTKMVLLCILIIIVGTVIQMYAIFHSPTFTTEKILAKSQISAEIYNNIRVKCTNLTNEQVINNLAENYMAKNHISDKDK